MKPYVSAPCANCPFRKVGAIELHPARVPGIIKTLHNDQNFFTCHKTLEARQRLICMGALTFMWKQFGRLPVIIRQAISMRIASLEDIEKHAGDVIDEKDLP